jgi:hypothetical protein
MRSIYFKLGDKNWYTRLQKKLDKTRDECRRTGTELPAFACKIKIPELRITNAFVIDNSIVDDSGEITDYSSNFLTGNYNVKMLFDCSSSSLFLTTNNNPERFCELIKGRTLKDLVVKANVDIEGFFFDTNTNYIKKALK